ncbi:amino acid ABC transporter permease [Oleomonas cavernae]|uniref:Amino acid ABC transporter permease n=1 Tax=Oleomonas cavernae TaxID=2320859 RepID=A0A418WCD1_9PROT|nr:amino acid ABC transporter permease [Oleomonas cavernae]RJF87691.1 amino acid ABC transporter permease [Oleomonas cavernae]
MTSSSSRPAAKPSGVRPWRDPQVIAIVSQIVLLALVLGVGWYLFQNVQDNLRRQNVATGFDFLDRSASFDIVQNLISYDSGSTYGRMFLIAVLNTLLVSAIGIVLATLIGFIVGIARLSNNWLVAKVATVYVEVMRNVPLLLHIAFWYVSVLKALPVVRDSISIENTFYLNQRGITFPGPVLESAFLPFIIAVVLAFVAAIAVRIWAHKRHMDTGRSFPAFWTALGLIIGLPLLTYLFAGDPVSWEMPAKGTFNIAGGVTIIPELAALAIALSLYTASFIAEIVRAGIQSVGKGQSEAAHSLGIRHGTTLRLVVIPQALRVIIPPLTSQYLNLLKNSSLGAAIGYPELVAVMTGTVNSQTNQAVEAIALAMAVYLTVSLLISAGMNWYNARKALVER